MENYFLEVLGSAWNKLPHNSTSEIDARNFGTVEHLLPNHDFHCVLLRDNYFGGVGIHIHKGIFGVQIMDELSIQKSYRC